MIRLLVLTILVSFSEFSIADIYECKNESKKFKHQVQYVKWNTTDHTAVIRDGLGTHHGKVISIRKHNNGKKINIMVNNSDPSFVGPISEYIIFNWEGKYRIAGVNYIYEGENRLLDTMAGNIEIECKKKI